MEYLKQNSDLTLEEGLEEYNKNYPFLNDNSGKSEASRWFKNHDITHVLFGTIPFQIRGETINDVWSLSGTNVTWKRYKTFFKYVDYSTVMKSYKKRYKYTFIVYLIMFKQLPVSCVAWYRGKKMTKKWDWFEYSSYLGMKLKDIRKEFNIKVIRP